MPETTNTETTPITPPKPGEFCHAHFSWLCQAGQGKCQRGERPTPEPEGASDA